jgi:hypothetical protein
MTLFSKEEIDWFMKRIMILAFAAASLVLAQPEPKQITVMAGPGPGPEFMPAAQMSPVQGAPFSATIVNESIQTLADGNRIVQRFTGTTARDSEGRTRRDTELPPIGNMSAANAPHLVFIQDPVAQTAYTLNLTDKTAHKMPTARPGMAVARAMVNTTAVAQVAGSVSIAGGGVAAAGGDRAFFFQKQIADDPAEVRTENLGTQTMQGVSVEGLRTTRTIAAGEIGNDRPIDVVTEVWTSPELKTIVYSKRSDPRMGEQTFQLTNIVRSEPDASLFTIPSDFKLSDGPDSKGNVIFYKPNE